MPLLYSIGKITVGKAMMIGWRPRVEGLEHIPATGGAIFAGNHLSVADELFLGSVVPRHVAFWANLPWSMKMVAGVASDVYPIAGSRRGAYLLISAVCSLAWYAWLAGVVQTKAAYLAASLLITVGLMIQDEVADALSVEVARTDEEMGHIQTLGQMFTLGGGIGVGYLSGFLAGTIGPP